MRQGRLDRRAAADGNWHNPGNWQEGAAPTATDHAVVSSGIPTISGGDAEVGSIAVSSGLQIEDGRKLTIGDTAPSTWTGGNISIVGAGTVENTGDLRACSRRRARSAPRPPQPPSEVAPELGEEVDEPLLRALAKDPRDRWPTCTAFAQRLADALATREPRG